VPSLPARFPFDGDDPWSVLVIGLNGMMLPEPSDRPCRDHWVDDLGERSVIVPYRLHDRPADRPENHLQDKLVTTQAVIMIGADQCHPAIWASLPATA
jgi:hypothetical protein